MQHRQPIGFRRPSPTTDTSAAPAALRGGTPPSRIVAADRAGEEQAHVRPVVYRLIRTEQRGPALICTYVAHGGEEVG